MLAVAFSLLKAYDFLGVDLVDCPEIACKTLQVVR